MRVQISARCGLRKCQAALCVIRCPTACHASSVSAGGRASSSARGASAVSALLGGSLPPPPPPFAHIRPSKYVLKPQTLVTLAGPPGASSSPQQATGFKVLRIAGDGSCQFRAVVQGVQVATHGAPMAPAGEGTAAHNLRLAVVEELKKRREEIEPFLPGILEGVSFERYCANMSNPGTWGGEPELQMATYVIGRPITVYHLTPGGLEPIVTYGDNLLAKGVAPVSVLWSGTHYDLLVPVKA